MSDNAIQTLCMTLVMVVAIIAGTLIILLYPGDKELLIGHVASGAIALMTWLRVNKVVGDNTKSNEIVQKQVQTVTEKADSIIENSK